MNDMNKEINGMNGLCSIKKNVLFTFFIRRPETEKV